MRQKIFYANENQKGAGVALLISDKTDIKWKTVTIDKDGHYIMSKESTHQEDITIINICVPNIEAPKYKANINRFERRNREQYCNTRWLWYLHSTMNRSFRQNVNREIMVLNYTLHQMDLTDTYRTFHPIAPEYTFFWSTHRTFSGICHMLAHKTSLNKFPKTETISSIFETAMVCWVFLIMKGYWVSWEAIFASLEIIMWVFFLYLFNVIHYTDQFFMSNYPYITGLNPTWLWYIVF